MRSFVQVLEAWRTGHITTNEAMEMTGTRDQAGLKALAREHGVDLGRRDAERRRRAYHDPAAGERPGARQ